MVTKNKDTLTRKILIVDDDPDILQVMGLVLKREGYTSMPVFVGSEVISAATEYKPDVILLDMLLSGVDGRFICQDLKNTNATRKIPIIMISAHPAAEQISIEAGADDFIPKPFSIDLFIKSIEKHIS